MEKKRIFIWMCALTVLAGLINTLSIRNFAITVSHITGIVSNTAISIYNGTPANAGWLLSVVGAFLAGAIISAYITGERKFFLRRIYGYIVIAIGVLLFVGVHTLSREGRMIVYLFALLMGIQNGMIVSFKGVLVRMTHMTGYLTDLGVYIGYRLRGEIKEDVWMGIVPASGLAVFTLGGILGLWMFSKIGYGAYDVTAAAYIVLGIAYLVHQKHINNMNLDDIPDDEQVFSIENAIGTGV